MALCGGAAVEGKSILVSFVTWASISLSVHHKR